MNICILMGNICSDIVLKQINEKAVVANFSLAINRDYKKSDGTKAKETCFVNCEAWDTGGTMIEKFFKKGDRIIIQASLKQDNWEVEGANGTKEKRSRLKMRVDKFFFPGALNKGNNSSNEDNDEESAVSNKNDDEIPF